MYIRMQSMSYSNFTLAVLELFPAIMHCNLTGNTAAIYCTVLELRKDVMLPSGVSASHLCPSIEGVQVYSGG